MGDTVLTPPITTEMRREATAYVAALTDDTYTPMTWQVYDDRKGGDWRKARNFSGDLRDCGPRLLAANRDGCGVFVTVARTDLTGRKAANIVRIRALFADFDGAPEPAPHLPPSIRVQSAHGQHWYWRVGDCDLTDFEAAQKRLALHYGSDPRVHDLPRVMRVPGFWHQKGEPFHVSLLTAPAHVYRLADVLDGLPALPEPVRPPARQFGTAAGQRTADWRQVDALAEFVAAGMYGRSLGGGKHAVVCPWGHEHTHDDPTGRSGATVIWEPHASRSGVATFRCEHTHCDGRYMAHALEAIGAVQPRGTR